MVSKIINDWLNQGVSESTLPVNDIRRKNSLIPILTNDKGINQTPKPLFTMFLDKTELDSDLLPQHLATLEKKFLHATAINLDKYVSKDENGEEKSHQDDLDMKSTLIEYDRKNIYLSRVMFNLFEMPDSSVPKASEEYYKVVERNEQYQSALEKHKEFPENYLEECSQTEYIDSIEKQIETMPMVLLNKDCIVNNYLMKKHYNRSEMKIKPPPKTFKEFCDNKTKFRDFEELMTNIDNYPEILHSFKDALYTIEKTLNYNIFQNSVLEYCGCEKNILNSDIIAEENSEELMNENKFGASEPFEVKLHLTFHLDNMKEDYQVTCVQVSPANPSVFVVGYGVSRFTEMDHDPRGMILFWNIQKCGYPEKIFHTEEIVTCLEFSITQPYLVAVGMRYGLIAIFDLRKPGLYSTINNYSSKVRQFGSIQNVRWIKKKYAMEKEIEVLLSLSLDGTIGCWTHGRLLDGYIMRHVKRGSDVTEKEQRMIIAIDTAGMCMQIKPDNFETFIVGTIEGQVLQAEMSEPDSYSYIYNCHNGPVYALEWSPLVTDVFITCGTDRSIHIWQNGKAKPSKSLSLEEVVLKVAWSCVKSTLFAAMCERKILFFDLSLDLHKEITELTSTRDVTFTFLKFCPQNNWFLVGHSNGTVELYELVNIPLLKVEQGEALRNTFLSD